MCGITGIFNVNGKKLSIQTLKRMTDVITHRGPDSSGYWTDTFVGFGHRRLAILDLTETGHQPMLSQDKQLIITFNGEIYNYQEIKNELVMRGYRFISTSDTEVLLYAYQEWGTECLKMLNGMFAFAIWDNRSQQLFAARDRYGIKPFYYTFQNGSLLFGSEIKCLLVHPDMTANVNLFALNEYFTFQNIFTDQTMFEGINLLPPGHYLTATLGDYNHLQIKQYWDFYFQPENNIDEIEAEKELYRLFHASVKSQLHADVEAGTYLSGGVDSGFITCIASRYQKNIKTFTCGFDLNSASGMELACDERESAEYLSYLFKTEHYEIVLKAGDMERVMPRIIWHLEDPRVGQSYPNFYTSRLASKFVKVMLAGTGGDEIFAGYPWRYYNSAAPLSYDRFVENYYNYWTRIVPDDAKSNFFNPEVYHEIRDYQTRDIFQTIMAKYQPQYSPSEDYLNASLYLEAKTFLHGLLIVDDKLSMAHSLETRVPLLDNTIVDFALRLPGNLKLRKSLANPRLDENEPGMRKIAYRNENPNGKYILRKLLQQYLPESYTKLKKQGFSAPDGSWFRGESIQYIQNLLLTPKAPYL